MSNQKQRQSTFFGGAAILSLGVIITKIIGALYKIPLANVIGDGGYGYFTTAYNIYSLLLTVSTAGLPVALSKTVSEANTLGRYNQMYRTFRVALAFFFSLGLVSFLVMFALGPQITLAMGNPGALVAVRTLAPAVLFVCCMSAFRGFTQGQGQMAPTAISQIIEALCKLLLGLSVAWFFASQAYQASDLAGAAASLTGEELTAALQEHKEQLSAAGAIAGVTIGTFLGLVFLSSNRFLSDRTNPKVANDTPGPRRAILLNLIKIGIPITIGSSVVSIVTLVDNALILNRLQEALGMTYTQANDLYGTYCTAMALYNLPPSLMIPLTASVLPAVSACKARRDAPGASKIAGSALRMAMIVACPAGVGLCALSTPIMNLLYPGYDLSVTGPCMAVLGIASIFVCIMMLCNSTLQAYGYVNLPIGVMLIGGVVKLGVNYVLVGFEEINVFGASIGTLACFGVVAVLELIIIKRVIPSPPKFAKVFVKPVLASVLMGAGGWAVYQLLYRFLSNSALSSLTAPTQGEMDAALSHASNLAVIPAIAVAAVIYFALVVALGILSKEDLSLMPKGDKLAKLLRAK